ncbi:MAG TPA: NADPH-dependent FMN reductase [Polyangiales bacterium]|jgi:FMN reductase|nr:NADPH-dependent FMN reductase [Polyangiales bacterium]
MSTTLIISGSPSSSSRSRRFAAVLAERLGQRGIDSSLLDLKSLPAEPLLHAQVDHPEIVEAVQRLAAATGVIVVTPVYKAAYSGLLKTFLDLLPQFALRNKVVLPFALGGTVAHVLSIDYALRPVLSSLDPHHIVQGLFVLDKHVVVSEQDGRVELEPDLSPKIDASIESFSNCLRRAQHQFD